MNSPASPGTDSRAVVVVTDDDELARAVSRIVPSSRRSAGATEAQRTEPHRLTVYDLGSGNLDELATLGERVPLVACYPPDQPDLASRALRRGAADTVRRDLLAEQPSLLKRRLDGAVLADDGTDSPSLSTDQSVGEQLLRDVFRLGDELAADTDDEIERLLSEGCESLGLETGVVTRTDGGSERVIAQVGTGTGAGCPPWSERREGAAVFVPDVRRSDAVEQTDADAAPGAFVGCPVTAGTTRYGTLCFRAPEARDPFSEYERTLVALLARWIGYELERREQNRRLAVRDAAIDAAADGFYRLDEEGRFTMVNDALVEMSGYDRDELLGEYVSVVIDDDDAARGQQLIGEALSDADPETLSLPVTIQRKDGDSYPAESRISVITDEEGRFQGTIGVSRDVSAQRAFEETLTELNDVSRGLLTAEGEDDIARTVVDAADVLIDGAVSGVFLLDEDSNALEPAAVSERAESVLDEIPTFEAGDGIAWEAFVTGDPRVYDDVRNSEAVYNPETAIRSEIAVPVGDHGVVLVGSTAFEQFEERTLELATILAANAEAALDRMDRERRLRERERELRRQNRRLTQLDEINDRVRRIAHELLDAESRQEIEHLVCERLADVDEYEFVWIGTAPSTSSALEPRAWSGAERGYLDAIAATGPERSDEPSERAGTDRETVAVPRVADRLRDGAWRREALSRDFTAVVSVPLVTNGVPYGVLSVYPNATEAVTDDTIAVLEELGDSIAHAIHEVEQRQARLSDRQVELEFLVADASTTLQAVSERITGPMTVERVVAREDGSHLLYGTAAAELQDDFEATVSEMHGVTDSRILDADGEQFRFELGLSGPSMAATVVDHDGSFQQLTLDGGSAHLATEFPAGAPINEIIDRFVERYPSAELLARRETERDPPTGEDDLLDGLTDRQREALDVAYHGGFFEWPRDSTGEEIAETLEITAPTFLEHLRRAERDVIGALFEAE